MNVFHLTTEQANQLELDRLRFTNLFDEVRNPNDWKAPINTWVPERLVDDYAAAIMFMTATETCRHQTRFTAAKGDKEPMIRISSIGYRRGPAGDH